MLSVKYVHAFDNIIISVSAFVIAKYYSTNMRTVGESQMGIVDSLANQDVEISYGLLDLNPKTKYNFHGKLVDSGSTDTDQQNGKPVSHGTVELMCDEQASLFNHNTTPDMILDYGCNADVHAQQERLVLRHFCDCLMKLICRGKAKGKECTSFKTSGRFIYFRDNPKPEIQIY